MKYRITIWLLLVWFAAAMSQTTQSNPGIPGYYGFSGLSFIPTSQTTSHGRWIVGYRTKPGSGEDLNLLPFSFNVSFAPFTEGLELAFTNTYVYASNRRYGGVPYKESMDSLNTILPIVPSVKYRFMDRTPSNFQVSMAVGVGVPYGAYVVLDKFFDFKVVDVTVHTGIGSKLTTYHAFAGATLAFGNRVGRYGRDFPLQLSVEGAWGGSLDQLDQKEEAFVAVSIRQAWTRSLFLSAFFRIDQQPSVQDGREVLPKPTKKMGLGLAVVL